MHDKSVCLDGVYDKAVEAIKLAKSKGFRIQINCTLFDGADPERIAAFFDEMKAMGLDGITVSPGYAYERAPDQQHFLNRERTKKLFRDIFARGNGGKDWAFTQSALFLDFLAGNQTYECTPWSMPLRTVFGWQKPCYLLGEGYAKTFKELMEDTDWDEYGVGKYEKCANCMVHCGFEGTAVTDAIKHPLKMLPIADARREDRRPDGAGHRPVKPAPGRVRLLTPRRAQDVRDQGRQVQHHRGRGSGVVPRRPCSTPAPVRISAGICRGLSQQRAQHRGRCAMPPSGFIATSAAGGSTWPASSEITRSAANGRSRAAAKRAATWRFHVDRQRAGVRDAAPPWRPPRQMIDVAADDWP